MNIMRKLRGGVTNTSATSTMADSGSGPAIGSQQHTQLGLMHLKKLFSEYTHPTHPLTDQEKEDKLYNMLPLFCKVFGASPTCDMNEKFWDILAFCHQVSLLMVSEIRKRASNQSTEMASCAIAKFLEIENCEESSNGWMLLSTLNLLAAGDATLVRVMSEVSVPSTLVKCLYLFFDLPEINEESEDAIQQNLNNSGGNKENNASSALTSDFTPRERRILLQKIFVQLLVRLCSHRIPAEELARKDDLTLLFSAITSWCPQHNVMWRKSAAEVLMTLSRHGLTPPVVGYIHSKGCVALCIENMKRVPELAPLELVEMFVTLFCFLKDSSEVSSTLLDDFRQAQGYLFLSEFLLKLESEKSNEAQESIRNLVLMVTSLCMCGYIELKPSQASTGSLFQMQGFTLPQPSGKGTSVRNIQAFHVLQTTFLKSSSSLLCSTILDAISNIYHSDNANYFILENQNTLSQFTERIHHKSEEIQTKLFELIEFLVFQLNFVPCKELISMSIFLKTHSSNHCDCSIACVQTLLNILKHNAIFKDVYREVGMLEVFVTCLNRYADFLEQKRPAEEGQQKLGNLIVEALTHLLSGNAANANVLRECGGAKCVHSLVQYPECRYSALGIIKELILTAGGDDDMAQLLFTLHSAPSTALQLKIDILEALRLCLKESHRTRTVFRKVNGFVYVTSVLVALENKLSQLETNPEVLTLLYLVFHTISTAMRFEPANAKFFYHEICKTSLCDTLRLLGCFTQEKIETISEDTEEELHSSCGGIVDNSGNDGKQQEGPSRSPSLDLQDVYHRLFVGSVTNPEFTDQVSPPLFYATLVYRMLYDLALDLFDKPNTNTCALMMKSPSLTRQSSTEPQTNNGVGKRSNVTSLNLNPPVPDPIVVHPGVMVAMLQLLPCIKKEENRESQSLNLQMYIAEVIKSLVRSERNQQVMCDKEFVGHLLKVGSVPIQNENHPLHGPLQYMLERLAAQALEPIDLRNFLRLGNPLNCLQLEDFKEGCGGGGPVPLTRIKTLVSMTTPKDFRASQTSYTLPPFVEFDMSAEGFGCLYLPSVAPQSAGAPSVVSSMDGNVLGGIGAGDRLFPPQTGLSYCTWICVDKFSDPRTDPHCVRLLTLVRNFNGTSSSSSARDSQDHLVCLSIVLSARDKAIIVSTQETHVPNHVGDWEPEGCGEHGVRVWCPDILQEGQWHHVAVVLNRAVLKNSTFALYLDGQQIHSQKMHYISQNPGGGAGGGSATNLAAMTASVYGYIGTPPAWRRYSRLCWKQGPCHLFEEVLTPTVVSQMYHLGPHYMGSFLAPPLMMLGGTHAQLSLHNSSGNSSATSQSTLDPSSHNHHSNGSTMTPSQPLVSEEKVVFGLNAKAVSQLTLHKIRKVYSRADNKSIAKQLGMSSHESATPIRILHNSAGHLAGAARSLGGVVVGYLGVRVFCPRPVATTIDTVGGCSVLLGLIAMAQDIESLYASVKALVCVVRSNKTAQHEMDRRRGYQTLAMLLRRKRALLNSHILHLAFSLVGTVDSGRESSAIPNRTAFQDLLCDLDVWHEAPGELLRSHLEHLYELAAESSEKRNNAWIMRDLRLVEKLLHITPEVKHNATRQVLFSLLSVLLGVQPRQQDFLLFGQFVASTLPQSSSINEKAITNLKESESSGNEKEGDGYSTEQQAAIILMRNRCLALVHSMLFGGNNNARNMVADELVRTLGFDWILLFMQPNLHSTSVVWALRILVVVCSHPTLMSRFREGSSNGGWLRYTDQVAHNKMAVVLGYQINSGTSQQHGGSGSGHTNHPSESSNNKSQSSAEALHIPGFQHLNWLLPYHLDVPEIYFLLTSLIMGVVPAGGHKSALAHATSPPTTNIKFELDTVWTFLWGSSSSSTNNVTTTSRINLCPEAVVVLLNMARKILHSYPHSTGTNSDESTNATSNLPDWLENHPIAIVQVLFQLYHNMPEFMPIFMSAEVLSALASVLFPLPTIPSLTCMDSADSSGASTPTTCCSIDDGLSSDQNSIVIIPHHNPCSNNSATPRLLLLEESPLTCHPTRQFIVDFIRVIVVDSLSLSTSGSGKIPTPVIDLVLDAYPENSTTNQQICYQTEILQTLMDHLLAADMLVGDQAAIPVVPLANAHIQHVTPNVFYLTARIVDKLWQGALTKDPHEVFDFIVKLICQAKRRTNSGASCANLSLECLYHCLNRSILFLLSRSTQTIADQMSVLEALHKLTTNRLIVFGAGNHELDFIGCLTYCLLQLTADMRITLETSVNGSHGSGGGSGGGSSMPKTTWHVNPSSDLESRDELLNVHQGRNLMAGAALRVWEELYVCKKPAIEEVFKVTLAPPHPPNAKAPDLIIVREQVFEAASKWWLNYLDAERKAVYRVPWEFHNQIQSKIHKVTGGLTRLASRTKSSRKDENTVGTMIGGSRKTRTLMNKKQSFAWTSNHVNLVRELVEMRRQQHFNTTHHTQLYVHQEWLQTESELLTRERGLWGPPLPCYLDKWQLDMTEGPHRMRKKTMKNDLFYLHYPYRPEHEKGGPGAVKYKVATSLHSKAYYMAQMRKQQQHNNGSSTTTTEPPERSDSITLATEDPQQPSSSSPLPPPLTPLPPPTPPILTKLKPSNSSTSDPTNSSGVATLEDQQEENESSNLGGGEESEQPPYDNQTLMRLLEENEKITYMFRCARIQGLDTTEGLLLFGQEHCYVVDGFTLLKNREIRDIDSVLSPGVHSNNAALQEYEPILPSNPATTTTGGSSTTQGSPSRCKSQSSSSAAMTRQCSKFSYEDIREVHKRRYLLQPMALEVFSRDGRNYLLAFPRKQRNKVYQRFMQLATGMADSAQLSVAGQKRSANVEQAASLLSNLLGDTSVAQRWVRGEISNFQYLMYLNTLAGRSYNDLMQYPVFPWILADYDSEELDFGDPCTFRDFTKPMGAQSPDRLEQFRKRFKEWDDPHGETPPYHYGTHYSSAMIVCSYLVRTEPFTQHFLRLQGGHFDLADRMFHSIKEAWLSASKHNMADVKELIPEFFYLPEFLLNANQFDLGVKQNGVALGDVVLPPWAKQDPREFIRVHRMALECDYVSQNLHHWIDLIFGYKQQGQPAVDAVNVFHHLFYEGNVDIYNIDDPLKKNATIGFINNFGQIPKQLFKKAHPCKKNLGTLGSSTNHIASSNPMSSGGGNRNSTVILDTSALNLVQAFTLPQPEKLFFHHLDNLRPSMQPIKEVKSPVGQILHLDNNRQQVLAVEQNKVLIPPTYNKYVAWGFADHSLRIGNYDSDKAVFVSESVIQNNGEILTCVCPSAKTIVTAGTSTVVTIWEYDGARKKSLNIKHNLYAHTDAVTCLAASPAYNVIVSGSRDCTAIIWDLSRGIFVRQLRGHASGAPVAAVAVNDLTGDVATCAATWLHVWSINGDELAAVNTCVGSCVVGLGAQDRMQQILCCTFSQTHEWDNSNVVITGSTDGVTRMWSIDYVQVPDENYQKETATSQQQQHNNVVQPQSPGGAQTTTSGVHSNRPSPLHHPHPRLSKQINVVSNQSTSINMDDNNSQTTNSPPATGIALMKSGSESSLSEDGANRGKNRIRIHSSSVEKPTSTTSKNEVCSGSPKEWRSEQQNEKETCSDTEEQSNNNNNNNNNNNSSNSNLGEVHPVAPARRRRRSRVQQHEGFRKSEGGNSADSASLDVAEDPSLSLRTSKSDTSLTDSFVVVPPVQQQPAAPSGGGIINSKLTLRRRTTLNPMNVLRPGFKWQRQLVFRSKLTMHTAYDRKDNAEPASITALAVSRDHRTVFVGDTRGRVFSWSVCDQPGRTPSDHWQKDESADFCASCTVKFTIYERKHHCRNCGQVFCSKCSRFQSEISRMSIFKPVRVCQTCYAALKGDK